MLFNSFEFVFLFLPIVTLIYYLLQKLNQIEWARFFLVAASLFFYGWWNWHFLPLMVGSILFNYSIGKRISTSHSKSLLAFGIALNLAFLGYFKYVDFFIENYNFLTHSSIDLFTPLLPLAISFFTFQQIAFLVDCARGEKGECNRWNYFLFVSFFPQLIAGPIVHHKDILPQFEAEKNRSISFDNIAKGIFIFSIGLFKKVVIADNLSHFVHTGFDETLSIPFLQAWISALSYTFQLYFDFSGYSDMAIGAALLFNIELCINFASPYKATNIQEFWKRWHISLSQFLKDYLYIPLGGNRSKHWITCRNLLITFILAGMWHGAGWTFIIWGALHGVAIVIHRTWKKWGFEIGKKLGWITTFLFVTVAWVFFRATSFEKAIQMCKGLLGMNGFGPKSPSKAILNLFVCSEHSVVENTLILCLLITSCLVALMAKNSYQKMVHFQPKLKTVLASSFLLTISILFMQEMSEFLYFNF